MPYQYLTFSHLYEQEVRSSAPSFPVVAASATLSPVFLLPTSSTSHAATCCPHHSIPLSSQDYRHHPSQHLHHHHSSTSGRRRRHHHHHHHHRPTDTNDSGLLNITTLDSQDISQPISSPHSCSSTTASHPSSLHFDFLKVFKRRPSFKSNKSSSDSTFSTPASSRRSSFTSHFGFAALHPVSAASSANTSPAISRQVTKVSDYDALIQRTARQEQEEEIKRQSELRAYFGQAAETGLSLRRF
ncbi:uncharacterized protein MEPE_04168 [Melanopsichium pennsylvanicum]|uniref:Uncharacterized protein n=2 Tax=Melanopsichium pennsylvanicum TaxID=63383 RepID=A0AAJ4XN93_9BASI